MQRTQSLTKWGPMGFASSTSWQNNDDEGAFRHQFWRKTRRVAASLPFAEDLLAAYYCAFDRGTPLAVKTSLVGALAYFVLPADVIPDVLPILGFAERCCRAGDYHQPGVEPYPSGTSHGGAEQARRTFLGGLSGVHGRKMTLPMTCRAAIALSAAGASASG